MFSIQQEPQFDTWSDHVKPLLIEARLNTIFCDIIKKGEKTRFQKFYDAIYEIVEAEVEYEHFEGQGDYS